MNEDKDFCMSRYGAYRVRELARTVGINAPKTFRSMAGALIKMHDPRITVSGQPRTETMNVGINAHTVRGLEELCADLGMPVEDVGELIACADYTGYSERWV